MGAKAIKLGLRDKHPAYCYDLNVVWHMRYRIILNSTLTCQTITGFNSPSSVLKGTASLVLVSKSPSVPAKKLLIVKLIMMAISCKKMVSFGLSCVYLGESTSKRMSYRFPFSSGKFFFSSKPPIL